MLSNGTGVIDSTYYNNSDNEGNIIGSIYNYGDDIDKILRFNITNIKECMGKNEFPFCDDLIRKYYHDFIELTKKEK